MKRSLNEIENTMRRAGIGAGLHIGLAQDVAAAGAWLVARKLDGAGAVLAALGCEKDRAAAAETQAGRVVFPDGRCAICGPSAIDLVMAGETTETVRVCNADAPLLIAGLAGVAAQNHEKGFRLEFGVGPAVTITSDTTRIDGAGAAARCDVTISRQPVQPHSEAAMPAADGFVIDETVWRRLAQLAAKTYVPASEASRIKGAGAGLTDND